MPSPPLSPPPSSPLSSPLPSLLPFPLPAASRPPSNSLSDTVKSVSAPAVRGGHVRHRLQQTSHVHEGLSVREELQGLRGTRHCGQDAPARTRLRATGSGQRERERERKVRENKQGWREQAGPEREIRARMPCESPLCTAHVPLQPSSRSYSTLSYSTLFYPTLALSTLL